MRISEDERLAIRTVLSFGEQWGYGNLISHLKTGWAKKLIADGYASDEREAFCATNSTGYPIAMQADLVERGEWDETGARYRTATAKFKQRSRRKG